MRKIFIASSILFIISGTFVSAASFDKAVWIPYWRKTEGASSTLANIKTLTQMSPFAYELQKDGTIKNSLKIEDEPWTSLIREAKVRNVKVYPSILSYPQSTQAKYDFYILLAQRKSRATLVADVTSLVARNNFDGIDIDFENKSAETKPYFSAFLKELSIALHKKNKKLICTVEARTPPESRYATSSVEVLSKVEYANDYKVIGKVCDQVRIMAYDQAGDDLALTNQNKSSGNIYKPVADIDWVEKIATLALRDIPAKKIILGIPTYGYKYEIVQATGTSSLRYNRIGSMNFNYADVLAKSVGVIPKRNSAGELSFVYSTSTDADGKSLGMNKQFLVWYSDANAIADKVRIAKLYKLGGVVIFKVDGGNDPNIWEVLK